MKNIRKNAVWYFVAAFLVLTQSCVDSSTPPELPPISSFEMDYSGFNSDKSAELLVGNWMYSVLTIGVFNTYASVNMIVPTAAYRVALTKTPEYIDDNVWLWSFDFPVIGATYTAKLTGEAMRRGKVKWEMRIDRQGPDGFSSFLWFEGVSQDQDEASWTIYKDPIAPFKAMEISWKRAKADDDGTLKYTIANSKDSFYKSTIETGTNNNELFNRYYAVYRSDENSNIRIEWDTVTKTGRVKSPNHFKDEAWHCWNQYKLDDTCQ